jgi:transaldolase / glucose-6-phosphate isomerase
VVSIVKAKGMNPSKTGKSQQIEMLNSAGQAVWYDNLSRDVLDDGTLSQLIELGVSGLTSNPTIFQKAITTSAKYDDSIRTLVDIGINSAEAVCEELFVQDVARAADLLLPVYNASQQRDGFASLEVSPKLAFDTAGTVEAGLRLWKKLGRKNIMIKVPATKEGIPAVQSLLEQGINVNVTLIFSVERYAEVAQAYLNAIQTRLKEGKQVKKIASVASFFVSRVDSMVTKKLGKEDTTLLGKISVANCRLAYESYKHYFSTPEFASTGAQAQKPLWASTGVKSDKLDATFYVESLVAPNTIETLPPQTLKAVVEKLKVGSLEAMTVQNAKETLTLLEAQGIGFDELLEDLMTEGVKLFAESYADLLQSVESKIGDAVK